MPSVRKEAPTTRNIGEIEARDVKLMEFDLFADTLQFDEITHELSVH
jgi:hypothetical protein